MKKLALLLCLLPVVSFAATTSEDLATYQELCAREQDPVKRQNYCYILNESNHAQALFAELRQDIALV